MTDLRTRPPEAPPRARPGSAQIIGAIIAKDVRLFSRNRFVVLITLLVLVVWGIIYQFLPKTVDETFPIAVSIEDSAILAALPEDLTAVGGGQGVSVQLFPDLTSVTAAVEDGSEVTAGLVIPDGFTAALASGGTPEIIVVVPADLPPQYEELLQAAAAELGYGLLGQPPPVDLATQTEIVGTDRVGNQISLAEQMRPLFLVMILMVEVFALATLVAGEVQERTAVAVLATPASAAQFLTAKGVFGTVLAFSEVVVLGLLIGAFATGAPMILTALLLGAVLVTGVGLLVGGFGRDFVDTLVLGMVVMIPMLVPAMAALFPGAPPTWVTFMPTYGLVETVLGASAPGYTWADAAGALAVTAAWGIGLLVLGAAVLNRRVARL